MRVQVIAAFVGNMLSKPEVVSWFLIYFMAVGFVILLVFLRVRLLKILLKFAGPVCPGKVAKYRYIVYIYWSMRPFDSYALR